MLEAMLMIKKKVMENFIGLMEESIKDIGRMVNSMEKANIKEQTEF